MKISATILAFCLAVLPAGAAQADSISARPQPQADNAQTRPLPEAITAAAVTLGVNAGLTEALKHSIHKMRPDRSDDNSFPSRHASWAFAVSTAISNQFYGSEPWVPLVTQTAASAIGLQRVDGRHHYGSDVAAGAITGIASAEIGQIVSRLIFGSRAPHFAAACTMPAAPSISAASELVLPLTGGFDSGWGMNVRGNYPVNELFAFNAALGALALPYSDAPEAKPLRAVHLSAGFAGTTAIGASPLALRGGFSLGIAHRMRRHRGGASWSPRIGAEAELELRLTRHFGSSLGIEYNVITGYRALQTLNLSLASRCYF